MSAKQQKSPRYAATQSFFRDVLANERMIQCREEEIVLQQSRLFVGGVPGGEVQRKTTQHDAMEKGMVELWELCDKLDTELIEYCEKRSQALKVIDHIADTKAYEVVYLRYFRGCKFNDIAKKLFISEPHVYDLHRQAMSKLYSHIPVEYRQRP